MKKTKKSLNLDENERWHEEAQEALQILVPLAKAKRRVSYGRLGKWIGVPNAQNMNMPLDLIGNRLRELGGKGEIPQIQSIVVNKNTGMPGDGIYSHINGTVEEEWEKIFAYKRWDSVLAGFGLPPSSSTAREIKEIEKYASRKRGGSGEGKEHKRLKEYIQNNPRSIGIRLKNLVPTPEKMLLSGDRMDVSFENKHHWIGVEVKPATSDEKDIERGLYQCVKYRAVMEKQILDWGIQKDVRVILALGGELPRCLDIKRCKLGIKEKDVKENIKAS